MGKPVPPEARTKHGKPPQLEGIKQRANKGKWQKWQSLYAREKSEKSAPPQRWRNGIEQ